jgi:hypothetical protein
VKIVAALSMIAVLLPLIPSHASETEPISLRFYTYDYDRKGHIVDRASILCGVLGANGFEELGRTNQKGEVTVRYSQLFRPGNVAVMFCSASPDVQCTAVRLDTDHLRGFAEYNIRVTPLESIDRTTIVVPAKSKRK